MIGRKSYGECVFDLFNTCFLTLLMIVTIYPLLYCIFASVSSPYEMVKSTGILIRPLGFSLKSYELVFDNPMITTGYANTFIYLFLGIAVNLLMTSFGAYFLSRKNVLLRDIIMFIIVFTMFFSGGLIPLYLLVKSLGLTNTRSALIIPVAINTYNLIVMRTSFLAVPDSMEESAKMDGANDFTILFRIILPLSKAVIAVMLLFYGAYHWNSWFNAMIFLRDRSLYPLQLVLREILIGNSTSNMTASASGTDTEPVAITIKYATVIVATLPILAIYPFVQKYFVQGVMIGALKG